ncbi:coiled-coil and C2 domain-containing protein 2A [Caerostris extrusa]|uniref:Coiled-coil and C2 domain-containing protein 2A n=1 Tax=Caerostris extrusa TaxID=172846 RepID=A0AAV4WBZ8_CAEEX|nr:coiled-coil and C2 domain-containing protein 2A [Caerostris extrusa]
MKIERNSLKSKNRDFYQEQFSFLKMATMQETKIETTAEVISEIPENIKAELRKKRKKLKEKRVKSSLEESNFDLEEIKSEPYEEIQPKRDSVGKLPKLLPQISERRLPSPPDLSSDLIYQHSNPLQPLKPIPPPRKSKKGQFFSEISSQAKHLEKDSRIKTKLKKDNKKMLLRNLYLSKTDPSFKNEEEISDYDFFTRVWDKSEEEPLAPCESSDVAEGTSQDEADSVGLIRKELQEKLTSIEVVQRESASYIPFHIKIEKEKNSFFHPSYKPVPIQMKLPEGKEPRNLQDEGFFVGKKPEVSKRSINRLENRLITQKEFQWFGDDGLVKMLPDPVCRSPIRHVVEEDAEKFPDLEYVKLKGLRNAASNLKQNMQKGMQETAINNERQLRLKQYQKDIRQTKKLRDLQEAEQKSLWKSILSTWEELKQHRQTQGFTSTSLNLIIQEIKMDKATEKEEWERELLDELEEEMEDYEASSEKLFEEYESALNKWKQWNKALYKWSMIKYQKHINLRT